MCQYAGVSFFYIYKCKLPRVHVNTKKYINHQIFNISLFCSILTDSNTEKQIYVLDAYSWILSFQYLSIIQILWIFFMVLLAFLYPIPHFMSKFGSFGPKLKYNCKTKEVSVCVYGLFQLHINKIMMSYFPQ